MPAPAYFRTWARLWGKNKIEFSPARNVRSKQKQGNYKNLRRMHSDTGDVYVHWFDRSEEKFIKLFQKP